MPKDDSTQGMLSNITSPPQMGGYTNALSGSTSQKMQWFLLLFVAALVLLSLAVCVFVLLYKGNYLAFTIPDLPCLMLYQIVKHNFTTSPIHLPRIRP